MPSTHDVLTELSPAQRIMLAQLLWDTVAAEETNVPLDETTRKELDKRLAMEAAGQLTFEKWDSVKKLLLG